MKNPNSRRFRLAILLLAIGAVVFPVCVRAQVRLHGQILDLESREPVAFASIKVADSKQGSRSDENGRFELELPGGRYTLYISSVGYKTDTLSLRTGASDSLLVLLQPMTEVLKEVTIRPGRYRNKNNPAVELIRLVIEHRDENRVQNLDYFREEQYEKMLIGMSKLPRSVQEGRVLKNWRFVMENADSTKLEGKPVVPIFLQENVVDFVSRAAPKSSKRRIKATQSVRFPGLLDERGIDQGLQYLNQEINLYENYVVMLTDHFMSPIANNAPLFYRYYPMDTLEEQGVKVVRLAFFPRNKLDMLLQGDLYVALDSTYPVTRATFTVNPEINLNWVNTLEVEQEFKRLPSGKWLVDRENFRLEFGLRKDGMGVYAERFLSHRAPEINVPLPDSLFDAPQEYVYLPGAERPDSAYWSSSRHVPLSSTEANTYGNIDSLQQTPLFRTISQAFLIGINGYVPVKQAVEIGPLSTTYAFNPVEGDRFRFGGRTATTLSTRFRLEGYGAYGTLDKRWKYSAGGSFTLNKTHINKFPLNLIRFQYLHDLRIPGQVLQTANSNSIFTSFVRGANDRFLFTDRAFLRYEREFPNNFSFMAGLEHQELRPAGALEFLSTDQGLPVQKPVRTSNLMVQMRYAPGEKFFQSATSRQIINYNYVMTLQYNKGLSGFLGGDYNYDELNFTFKKFSQLPPIGYNWLYLEAGGIFGKVPYPLLTIHRANQTYFYQPNGFNMMNFMEFISDRYVSLTIDHNFYGFFLNKVPLLRRLKLRETASFKVLYGDVSARNRPEQGNGLFYFPSYADGTPISYSLDAKPYMEASVGISNIFRVLRLDVVRRLSYLDHPGAPKYGIRGYLQFYF